MFSSGYLANLGALTALGGRDVTIVSDAGNHASIIDACRLSGSPIAVLPHRDLDKLDAALAGVDTPHALVVTDAVFSVDGDLAPLRDIHDIARQYRAILVVDEAHALGVVGDGGVGAIAAAGLGAEPDVVRTVTLSKSLGSQGGAVLGAPEVIDLLVNTARAFIFDTGLAPSSVGAALAALRILLAEPERAASTRAIACALARVVTSLGVETVSPGCRRGACLPRRSAAGIRRRLRVPGRRRAGRLLPPAVGTAGPIVPAIDRASRSDRGRPRPRGRRARHRARVSVLLVSGTGTDVGKTVATAALAACAIGTVAVVKPAQTGVVARGARRLSRGHQAVRL